MDRLKLFFYREGEHFEYPEAVRQALGQPCAAPLAPGGAGFDTVERQEDADFLVFPYKLDPIICHKRTAFARRMLENLPYFAREERRHVVFNFHDLGQPLCTSACIVTDDPRRSNQEDPFVYPFPHFPLRHVLAAAPDLNFAKIRFDVSFVGTISDPVRLALLQGIERERRLRHYISAPQAPEWNLGASYLHMKGAARRARLERLYLGVMARSWATLCPRGRGSSSIRFFETLCLGRLPVHVSDEYVLPLADRIDYAAFCLFLPEADAPRAGEAVHAWLAGKGREERAAMCRQARQAWEEHLAPEREQEIALDILRRHKSVMPKAAPRLVRLSPGCLRDERPRRNYPAGYFSGMVLDDGRSWFGGAMMPMDGPRPGTVRVNGLPGDFPRVALNALYHAGRMLPANAVLADIGCGAGVSAMVLASARLSRRDLAARVFCVEPWPAAGLAALRANAANAGVEFLLEPMAMTGAEAASCFAEGTLDMLLLHRGQTAADLRRWWAALKPGGAALAIREPGAMVPEDLSAFAAGCGLHGEWGRELGIFRVVKLAAQELSAA